LIAKNLYVATNNADRQKRSRVDFNTYTRLSARPLFLRLRVVWNMTIRIHTQKRDGRIAGNASHAPLSVVVQTVRIQDPSDVGYAE
jgi:hypothetical protein